MHRKMLSVRGKAYSKIHSENPFYEEPQPKAFYHPTQEKSLSKEQKEVGLSPKRADGRRHQPGDEGQGGVEEERRFLSGCHDIRPLTSVQSHLPKSPDSSNFDESWPHSERPSSPSSVTTEDRRSQQSLPCASVRRHVQPTFTSRPLGQPVSTLTSPPLGPGGLLQWSGVGSEGTTGSLAAALSATGLPEGSGTERLALQSAHRAEGTKWKAEESGRKEGEGGKPGSVLQRYIERFRHGSPMSRQERLRQEGGGQREDFWWLDTALPTPNSTSTPKEEEGRSLPLTCQGQGRLTVDNVRRQDDLDTATRQLQEKAERMLHSAGSAASSGPVVSTEGLGSTGSDVTGSSFSEAAVRPTFHPREMDRAFPGQAAKGRAAVSTPQEDILFKWRLQRKLEAARHAPCLPSHADPCRLPKTAAERDVERRLATFRDSLLGRGSVAETHLREARVEKDMKHVQATMDTAVQTSPAKSPPSSFLTSPHPHPHTLPLPLPQPPSWFNGHDSSSARNDGNGTGYTPLCPDPNTRACDAQPLYDKEKPFVSLTDRAVLSSGFKQTPGGKAENSSERDMQYRQFLEAEKPQDGGDCAVTRPASPPHPHPRPPTGRLGDSAVIAANRAKAGRRSEGIVVVAPRSAVSSQSTPCRMAGGGSQNAVAAPHPGASSQPTPPGGGATEQQPALQAHREKSGESTRPNPHAGDGSLACVETQEEPVLRPRPRLGDGGDVAEREAADPDSSSQPGSRRGSRRPNGPTAKQQQRQSNTGAGESSPPTAENSNNSNSNNSRRRGVGPSCRHGPDDGRPVREDPAGRRAKDPPCRTPPSDAGAGVRSGVERSGVMPPPQGCSSPARTPLSSAIGQVVQDRLFDVSVSVLSSVDSASSLQCSVVSPPVPCPASAAAESDPESDGEFELDPLLLVLRQQRERQETQLRCLDSILADRDTASLYLPV